MPKKPTFAFCPMCASPNEERDLEGTTRLACPQGDYVHYDNPTPVVAAIVERGDHVVLVRNVGWQESWYGLVTGFLEKGESAEDGIVREVAEELGIHDASGVSLVGLYPFEMMNQPIIAYHFRVPADAEIIPDPVEIADHKLAPTAKLKPWPFGTGEAVRVWLESRLM